MCKIGDNGDSFKNFKTVSDTWRMAKNKWQPRRLYKEYMRLHKESMRLHKDCITTYDMTLNSHIVYTFLPILFAVFCPLCAICDLNAQISRKKYK